MFGYRPTPDYELLPEDVDFTAVDRTKSRAYKLACLLGWTGIHWDFLGHPVMGHVWGAGFFVAWVPMVVDLFHGNPAGSHFAHGFFICWIVGMWLLGVFIIARLPEDHRLFRGAVDENFFPINAVRGGPMLWQPWCNEDWWVPKEKRPVPRGDEWGF